MAMIQILDHLSPFVEMAKIGAWEYYPETDDLFWSKEVYKIYGLQPGSKISKDYAISFYSPEDQSRISESLESAIVNHKPYNLICQLTSSQGSLLWVRTQGNAIFNEGKVEKVYGIIQNITEEVEKEIQSKKAEERFHSLIVSRNGWIWEVDSDLKIVFSSEGIQEVLGYSPAEVIGRTPYDFIPESDIQSIIAESTFLIQNKLPLVDFESWNLRKDGKKILLKTNAIPLVDSRGNLTGYRGVVEDITTQHIMEERSKQKELLLKEIHVARWEFDAVNQALIWNPGMYEILEIPTDREPSFEEFLNLIHSDDRAQVEKLYNDAYFTKSPLKSIHRLFLPGGRIKWVRSQVRTYTNKYGEPLRTLGILQDISEVQDLQDELISQKTYLESVMNSLNSSSIVSITDTRGRIIKANQKFCEVSGFKEEELLGKTHRIVNSGYHDPGFWKNLWDTITQGRYWRAEVKNQAKDGSFYWVDTSINPVYDSHGNIIQYLSIRNLITNRKTAEQKLQDQNEELRVTEEELRLTIEQLELSQRHLHESEEKLKGLLDSQTCFVLRTDMEGNYTYVNRKFKEVFGFLYYRADFIGKNCMNSIIPEDHPKVIEAIQSLIANPKDTIQVEIRKPIENGSVSSTLWDFTLLTNKDGTPREIQCVGIDFTDRKKAEEVTLLSKQVLEKLNQELEAERKELTEALDIINHEIDFAENLQEFLLPDKPEWGEAGLEVSTLFQPLDRVSGDLFDFFELRPSVYRFFIADATGHGLKAGFQTMFIQTEYQRIKDEFKEPGKVLYYLNQSIHKTFPYQPIYYTCTCMDLDLENNAIHYSNSAHPETILIQNGEVEILPVTSPIMGLRKDVDFPTKTISIQEEFRLIVYSDGITESHNKNMELFDLDKFIDFSLKGVNLSQSDFINELQSKLEQFREGHPIFDDMTLVMVDRKKTS